MSSAADSTHTGNLTAISLLPSSLRCASSSQTPLRPASPSTLTANSPTSLLLHTRASSPSSSTTGSSTSRVTSQRASSLCLASLSSKTASTSRNASGSTSSSGTSAKSSQSGSRQPAAFTAPSLTASFRVIHATTQPRSARRSATMTVCL